ncbi:chitobiase/beta-hexosaminidase C-terminal domain-containing protein [Leptospira sp. GIMC2001]|uniref:chitobiase/beta-hexosaminidase C-terminal domain-containing protein n=1 Tax=Leptospira sp. GIMC2001 TaxID=1513297 RepID=UPI00234A7CEC|nr:chitobiase/beta-hexosaminidase C-terminal domain-containing protein [Leptospira sp. GIMC2001]WCL48449.1 chitobiase/beta-hexosaminidase C-terminal domain-containing protein [Leptospira sp. GIMC2001]
MMSKFSNLTERITIYLTNPIVWIRSLFSFFLLGLFTSNCQLPGLERFPSEMLFLIRNTSNFKISGEILNLKGTGLKISISVSGSTGSLPIEELNLASGTQRFVSNSFYSNQNSYAVEILRNPTDPIQNCETSEGSGIINNADVNSVLISCTDTNTGIAQPTFSLPSGEYPIAQNITIATTTPGASIYYTDNGTNPNCLPIAGNLYTGAIALPQPTLPSINLRAIACKETLSSSISSATYSITNGLLDPPSLSIAPGSFGSSQVLTISAPSSPAGVVIHYTTNGVTPVCTDPIYAGAINIDFSQVLLAISCLPTYSKSSAVGGLYEIIGTTAPPTFSLPSNTYSNDQTLTLSTLTPGATIHYNLSIGSDPAVPTCGSSLYTTGIPITTNDTRIRAIACFPGWADSPPTIVYSYGLRVATPTLTPAAGTYKLDLTPTASSTTVGATLRYNTGADPNCSTSVTTPIVLNSETEITTSYRAIGCKPGYVNSLVANASYTLTGTLSAPNISLASGSYAGGQIVTISPPSIPTSGSSIHYTTDGSAPNCSSPSTPNPLSVNSTLTLRAIAYKTSPEWNASAETVESYTINGQVIAPTFSASPGLVGGIYANDQTITMSSATPGSVIRYTIGNGSQAAPTCSTGVLSSSVAISNNTNNTIKAIACKPSFVDSNIVVSPTYTLKVATPIAGLTPGTYTSNQAVNFGSATSGSDIRWSLGSVPNCGSSSGAVNLAQESGSQNLQAIGCKPGYENSNLFSGVYEMNGVVAQPTITGPAGLLNQVTVGKNPNPAIGLQTACYRLDGAPECSLVANGAVNSKGGFCATGSFPYTISVPISVTSNFQVRSCSSGWDNSPIASLPITITNTLGAIVFNPDPSIEANNTYNMTLSSAGSSKIFYRIDGTNPDCSGIGSIEYTAPILVNQDSVTYRAIGCSELKVPTPLAIKTSVMKVALPVITTTAVEGANSNVVFIQATQPTAGATNYYRVDGVNPNCASLTAPGTNTFPGAGKTFPDGSATNYDIRILGCRTNFQSSNSISKNFTFTTSIPYITTPIGTTVPNMSSLNKTTFYPKSNSPISWICTRTGAVDPACGATVNTCASGSNLIQNTSGVLSFNMESSITNLKAIACKVNFIGSPVVSWNYTLDENKLRIYKTTQSYTGNLNVAGMDAACGSDIARPYLGTGGLTFAGLRIGLGGAGDTRTLTNDFPLKASKQYFREDGVTSIGSTNAANNGFVYPLNNSVSPTPANASDFAWTGMGLTGSIWNLSANNCSGWSSTASNGATGNPWLSSTDSTTGTNKACSSLGSFYCVEREASLEPYYRWRFENDYLSSTANIKTGTEKKFGNIIFEKFPEFNSNNKEGSRSIRFTGPAGMAYDVGGSVDYGAINLGSKFSFTLWIRVDDVAGSYDEKLYTILSNQLNTNGEALGFSLTVNRWNNENRVLHAQFGSGIVKRTVVSNSNAISYDTWTHIAVTVDYTTGIAKLYKNGLPLTLATADTLPVNIPGAQSFRLGTLADYFNYRGYMDDVQYFTKALTDAEVLAIYNSY